MNINELANAECMEGFGFDASTKRLTLPTIAPELVHSSAPEQQYDLASALNTLLDDNITYGVYIPLAFINRSEQFITDTVDDVMTDRLMPAWSTKIEDVGVLIEWYHEMPMNWKTMAPQTGTRYAWRSPDGMRAVTKRDASIISSYVRQPDATGDQQ